MDERKLEILKAEPNVTLLESAWALAGLRPPTGVDVEDRRIRTRIGYRNGHRPRAVPRKYPASSHAFPAPSFGRHDSVRNGTRRLASAVAVSKKRT